MEILIFFTFMQEIQLDEILTHEVSLDDINRAFELLKDDDCIKVVLKINERQGNREKS